MIPIANPAGGHAEPQPSPDGRQVAAPTIVVATSEPTAPIHMLTKAQRRAIVDLFFAGVMTRKRMFFEADGYRDIPGQTMDVLFRERIVKLTVEILRDSKKRFIRYRHSVSLTRRGEWFAHSVMEAESRHQGAIEAIGAGLRDGTTVNTDNFELSPNVYGDGEEEEAERV